MPSAKRTVLNKRKNLKKKIPTVIKLPAKPQIVGPQLPEDWNQIDTSNIDNPVLYINRELSWLEFNQRVLDQANDPKHPLLERVKFLSIVGTNLDEFFMIRVATLLKKIRGEVDDVTPDGMTTFQQFWAVRERSEKMMEDQKNCWESSLRPLLVKQSIYFLEINEYTPEVTRYLTNHFMKEIYPVLTPLAFDPGHPFPHISNLSLNLAIVVNHNLEVKFARVKIPRVLSRFITIPEEISPKAGRTFVFLEDVIKCNMNELFPGTKIEEIYLFRVTRDTDLVIQEDEADDLLETVDHGLKQIQYGDVSLLQVEQDMPQRILDILAENFQVLDGVITRTDNRMGFGNWMELMKIPQPQLKDPPFSPPTLFSTQNQEAVFERIKIQDYLVHHPYESFVAVETFLKAAVADPNVIAIKMTLYRIGTDSPVIDYLIQAAEAGKQVAVLVELKARFDERNNIVWAKRLESFGVHVVYGLLNLKTHCKLCLVVRKESDGIRRYMHIGTGNYNSTTAKIYTDLGLFTANDELGQDVSHVFNYLTGYSNKKSYNQLLVAPVNMRSGIVELIEREIEHAKNGKTAHIMIKVNSLADHDMARCLYRASQAGVKIDMIIRGVCCLRPRVPGISDNIRVFSVIGRFLEHTRIYYFHNAGKEELYIGSADLMKRNLDRRVEAICPVLDETLKHHLKYIVLHTLLNDNDRQFVLNVDGNYERIDHQDEAPLMNSQEYLIQWYNSREAEVLLGHS